MLWRYRVLIRKSSALQAAGDLEEMLNKYGAEGWELASTDTSNADVITFFMKKGRRRRRRRGAVVTIQLAEDAYLLAIAAARVTEPLSRTAAVVLDDAVDAPTGTRTIRCAREVASELERWYANVATTYLSSDKSGHHEIAALARRAQWQVREGIRVSPAEPS